jgi:glycosyltransferase 2 family protein
MIGVEDGDAPPRWRSRLRLAAQIVFLVLVAVFLVWGVASQWEAIVAGLARVSIGPVIAATLLTAVAYLLFYGMWLLVVRRYGHPLGWVRGAAIFFLGQLGRYIPGGIWSFTAQAALAKDAGITVGVSVVAGLVSLGYLVVAALVIGLLVTAFGLLAIPLAPALATVFAVLALAATVPPPVNAIASRLARTRLRMTLLSTGAELGMGAASMLAMGLAPLALAVPFLTAPIDAATVALFVGAFAIAYVAGIVVVIAPAGIGVRDGLLILLLSPTIGVAEATIVALLSRLTSSVADVLLASGSWLADRRRARG